MYLLRVLFIMCVIIIVIIIINNNNVSIVHALFTVNDECISLSIKSVDKSYVLVFSTSFQATQPPTVHSAGRKMICSFHCPSVGYGIKD